MSATHDHGGAMHYTTLDTFGGARLPDWASGLQDRARAVAEDATQSLRLAEEFGSLLPMPGYGETALRWKLLATVAETNLTAARVLEAHSDALAIIHESGETPLKELDGVGGWGVFAAEAPGVSLTATPGPDGWILNGTKPWCSLGNELGQALVTAQLEGTEDPPARQLFAVSLQDDTVRAEPAELWVSRGLRSVTSASVHFNGTAARPIGAPGWYLRRPGFAWGGIGVAACWLGGALGLARTLRAAAVKRRDLLTELSVGTVEAALHGAAATMAQAADRIDDGVADGAVGAALALQVRAVVADAAERTLTQVAHTLGPAPLAFDETHACRVADLQIYLRQHHAERDLVSLGQRVLGDAS